MSFPPPRKMGLPSIGLVGLVTVFMLLLAVRRDRVLQPGQTLQFDDFFFTVRDALRSTPSRASGNVGPAGRVAYVVGLTIDNRAVRVPFRFSNAAVILIDPRDGRRYAVDAEAQRAREEATGERLPDPLVLKAGESATKHFVFSVPADVIAPRMQVMPGGWVGLFLDRLLTGTKEFQLP
jgi:hypothetical protein